MRGDLSLSKIFMTTLATQFILLDAEVNHLIEKFMNSAFDDSSNDGASTY